MGGVSNWKRVARTFVCLRRSSAMGKKAKNAGTKKGGDKADGKAQSLNDQFQKEFMLQQERITKAAIKLEDMDERKGRQEKELRRAIMTAKEVDPIDENTALFKQFGRMFLHLPKVEIMDRLEEEANKSQKEVKTVKDTMTYFEKQRNDAESNLREMMTQLESQMGNKQ